MQGYPSDQILREEVIATIDCHKRTDMTDEEFVDLIYMIAQSWEDLEKERVRLLKEFVND